MQNLLSFSSLFLISLLVTALDQLWKFMIQKVLVYGDSVSVIRGFFSITLVFNTGAAFGIMKDWQGVFIILPILTIFLILILFIKSKDKQRLLIPFGLLLGGTIGNFIDRLKYGYVVDFFDLFFKSWHWPAFNIADACICFGVLLLLLQIRKAPSHKTDRYVSSTY